MKKVLLVGTSFSAAPIYFALKKRGLHVTACGSINTDPCHQYADSSIYIDYSNPVALYDVVKNAEFDYIIPSCNDYSYISASKVANQFGFPGYDTNETTAILHTKNYFRKKTSEFNLKSPRTIQNIKDLTDKSFFPCVIKPVDSFSGRGVTKINFIAELSTSIDIAKRESRTGEFLLEEFIEGSLHSHSAFISKGNILIDFFVDEFCTVYPYQVNCSNHPSNTSKSIQTRVRFEIQKMAKELRITDGLLHTQFISRDNDFWIIECMRRCPGDLYSSLIERSTGVDYIDLFITPFLGSEYAKVNKFHEYYYGRHTISSDKQLVNFSFKPSLNQAELEIIQLKESGQKLSPAPFDKLAIILAKFKNKKIMTVATPKLADYFKINILD